ncbi:unannotated protein [freshwater metagenome]|uniref:Unannotated protein n=1 Tax=freshwater metagenome TaxID=449393 RepID=A0A6J7GU53_9ZZZZ
MSSEGSSIPLRRNASLAEARALMSCWPTSGVSRPLTATNPSIVVDTCNPTSRRRRLASASSIASGSISWSLVIRMRENVFGSRSHAAAVNSASIWDSPAEQRGKRVCASTNAATCARETEPSRHAAPITGTAPSQSPASSVRFTLANDSFVRDRNHADAVRNPASANVLPPATRAATSPLIASSCRFTSTRHNKPSAISSSSAQPNPSPPTTSRNASTAVRNPANAAPTCDRRPATSTAVGSVMHESVMVMGLQTSGMDTAHHDADAPAKTCGPDSTHPTP